MSTQSNKPALPKPTRRELNSNPYSQQGLALARLLANPDREIVLPGPPKSEIKTIRAPRDVIPGIQGSSAGAGSGEFHTYRAGRRRENERLDIMDQQDALDRKLAETAARAIEYATTAELKTSKNRLKRQRHKNNARAGSGAKNKEVDSDARGATTTTTVEGEMQDKKRKLGGSGGMKFMSAEDREEQSDDEEAGPIAPIEQVEEEDVAAAVVSGILIRDDD